MLRASPAFAQSSTPPSNALVLRVDPPGAPSDWFRGGLTITGVAVDCVSMQPATRVAAYRGTETDDYLADVSMEVSKNLQTYCSNGTGAANMGFRLILDTRRLNDGHNTLTFAAQYDTGTPEATRSASFDINVSNATWIWGQEPGRAPGQAVCGYGATGPLDPVQTANAPSANFPVTVVNGQVVPVPSPGYPYTVVNGVAIVQAYPNGSVTYPAGVPIRPFVAPICWTP